MVTIYHHNDADGKISGGIIYNFEKEYNKINEDSIKCIEVDYTNIIDISEIENGSTVYFVDFSFSEYKNINALIELVKIKKCNVVWIDHHRTSHSLLSNNDILKSIINNENFIAYVDTDYCASYLCYKYVYGKINNEDNISIEECPSIIKYVDSWDTWKHNIPNTVEFNNGFYINNIYPIDFTPNVICNNTSEFYSKNSKCSDWFVNKCISEGIVITKYKDRENESLRKRSIFNFYIFDKDAHKIYKCAAINARGNSTVFNNLIDMYDIICLYRYEHNQWVHSLYSNKEYIDCSKVAEALGDYESLGGGGHKGAAGFQTYSCILDNNCHIYYKKRKFLNSIYGNYSIKIMDGDYYE